jgi:hypothetical protein
MVFVTEYLCLVVVSIRPAKVTRDYSTTEAILKMIKGFLNIPYLIWTALALGIAGIFTHIWPAKAVTVTSGFRYFIIRWGHALTWILLAVSFFLRGIGPDLNGGSSFFALAGGMMYLLFMVMTFVIK